LELNLNFSFIASRKNCVFVYPVRKFANFSSVPHFEIIAWYVSRNQIVRLYSRFLSLDKQGRGYLDRDDFLRIPELAVNPLGDRIVDAFFTETEDLEQKINFREFIRVLAHFRPISKEKKNVLNSREEKLKFAFSMYDLNKNGFITRDEFKVILNM
uniref:EF-hand domain-containing protein n=1 Tax=Onchocerca flexuosa TaxID=387005 RepID=A0A183I6I5_9BILA